MKQLLYHMAWYINSHSPLCLLFHRHVGNDARLVCWCMLATPEWQSSDTLLLLLFHRHVGDDARLVLWCGAALHLLGLALDALHLSSGRGGMP